MHKLIIRIVSDTPRFQADRCISNSSDRTTRKPNVHSFSFDMKAVFGNPGTLSSQQGIGFRRPVSGNDMKRCAWRFQFVGQGVQIIQKLVIDGFDGTGPVIPEYAIDILHGSRRISSPGEIGDIQFFTGMGVIKI